MNICSKCKAVIKDGSCPICGKSKFMTEAKETDLVLLTSSDYVMSFCVEDTLKEEGIRYLKKGVLGSAISMTVGEFSETFNFYVFPSDYERALPLIPSFDDDFEFEDVTKNGEEEI